MGTQEPERKNYKAEPLSSINASDKSTEQFSESLSARKRERSADRGVGYPSERELFSKVKFEVYGEEMISKEVKQSGNSGRVYLPPDWIGKNLKIIRID